MTTNGQIGIGLLSFAHVHAEGYADAVKNNPDARILAVWDEDPARGQEQAEKLGVPFYETVDELLALPELDGVVLNAPTSMHKELIITAARAKKHIFTEKSLTITISDATDVLREVEEAGIQFMISLPMRTRPEILFAKKILDEGLLGDITLMRARIAHSASLDRWFSGRTAWFGEENEAGGGAFFDLGCHRVDVMRWFMGEPVSVAAQNVNFTNHYGIDDSMVAVVKFRNRALGILDVSWVQRGGPNPLELYGTEGYLGIDAAPNAPRIQLQSNKLKAGDLEGYIIPSNLPAAEPYPMNQWLSAIKDGTPMTISIHDGWNLVQLMEGCYESVRQGHEYIF